MAGKGGEGVAGCLLMAKSDWSVDTQAFHRLAYPINGVRGTTVPPASTWLVLLLVFFCAVQVQQETLFELILAANYMDIKPLLDLTCATVASMIKVG